MNTPALSLQSNDFELFGLPQQFAQNATALDAAWKRLQAQVHPDKFSAEPATSQRLAMQWSVRLNEAYQRLKKPISRAAYLCELAGAPIQAHHNTAMPTDFLMQQMQWREALADAGQDADALQTLFEAAQAWQKKALALCAQQLDNAHDALAAAGTVRQLLFVDKFLHEVENQLDF